ncbi:hypothetical protein ACLMJK_000531 [Lecanora helva]
MSTNPYEGQDPLVIAQQAERDLNSHEAKQGGYTSGESANESGIDTTAASRFPGASVTVGSAASGAGGNREIPPEEGGDIITKQSEKGQSHGPTKARDFEGAGGPETKAGLYEAANPGNDDVRGNVRQGGETRRA